MYEVDARDRVRVLEDVPPCSGGAPLPHVLANESRVVVAYLLQETDAAWDGSSPRGVTVDSAEEPLGIVVLERVRAHFLGPPNDEAFRGHPLYDRGLRPYGAFEIDDSSWIRRLERMNRVHPYHSPAHFADLRHIVLSFHDSTFECCCEGYVCHVTRAAMAESLEWMARLLRGEDE